MSRKPDPRDETAQPPNAEAEWEVARKRAKLYVLEQAFRKAAENDVAPDAALVTEYVALESAVYGRARKQTAPKRKRSSS